MSLICSLNCLGKQIYLRRQTYMRPHFFPSLHCLTHLNRHESRFLIRAAQADDTCGTSRSSSNCVDDWVEVGPIDSFLSAETGA